MGLQEYATTHSPIFYVGPGAGGREGQTVLTLKVSTLYRDQPNIRQKNRKQTVVYTRNGGLRIP